jgi:hypothetical protein
LAGLKTEGDGLKSGDRVSRISEREIGEFESGEWRGVTGE